jgi:hypothetical protein
MKDTIHKLATAVLAFIVVLQAVGDIRRSMDFHDLKAKLEQVRVDGVWSKTTVGEVIRRDDTGGPCKCCKCEACQCNAIEREKAKHGSP